MPFLHAHATHPQWQACAELALAQVLPRVSEAAPGEALLGIVYFTDAFGANAKDIVAHLRNRLPQVSAWSGGVGVGVMGSGAEYIDEPAIALMLLNLPHSSFRVFHGAQPLGGFAAHTALVHADGHTPDLPELIEELAERTASEQVFGGLVASREQAVQVADTGLGDGVFQGGLSGVAFTDAAGLHARVTQGCQAIGPKRRVSAADGHLLLSLDGEPALTCLLRDLELGPSSMQGRISAGAMDKLRRTLIGIEDTWEPQRVPRGLSSRTRVRHLIGLDPGRGAIAVAETLTVGDNLAFCERNTSAARADLRRICTELRAALEPETLSERQAAMMGEAADVPPAPGIAGAIYVSCAGRGGPHFGAPSAEAQLIRHALGDVPLIGFFAGGEIAHQQIHGYTGVLMVFAEQET